MDPRDTAPDSWEQEDDVEATIDGQLDPALMALNVNAKPFVPNVNAAEFVPTFVVKAQDLDSAGKSPVTLWSYFSYLLTGVWAGELLSH